MVMTRNFHLVASMLMNLNLVIMSLQKLAYNSDVDLLLCAGASHVGVIMHMCFTSCYAQVLHDTGVHHLRLLHILGRLALFMFLPVWLVVDLRNVMAHPQLVSRPTFFVVICCHVVL